MGSWVWHETIEEGQKMHRLKRSRCDYNNEDENNSQILKVIKITNVDMLQINNQPVIMKIISTDLLIFMKSYT